MIIDIRLKAETQTSKQAFSYFKSQAHVLCNLKTVKRTF